MSRQTPVPVTTQWQTFENVTSVHNRSSNGNKLETQVLENNTWVNPRSLGPGGTLRFGSFDGRVQRQAATVAIAVQKGNGEALVEFL